MKKVRYRAVWNRKKQLGHKNVRTTMNYCEVADGTIVKELERILDEKGKNGRKR